MRRAIAKHRTDFVAITALFLVALGIGGYIVVHQRLRLPLVQAQPFTIKAELTNAQAVTAGQGQTVRVAGVRIGDIGKVTLRNGHALVDLHIDPSYRGLIRSDATALLRAKTGLKDMFLEVDPGRGRPLRSGEVIPASNTAPDVNVDETLAALDADTRDYVKLLISGAGKGLRGRGAELREAFRRLEPLHRDLARVTGAVAERRRNLAHLVNRYSFLVKHLGDRGGDLTRLVRASDAALGAFAAEDRNVSATVARLPGTLRQTTTTLGKVDRLGRRLTPALESLRPPFRRLAGVNRALLPLATEGTPIVHSRLRPFARSTRPFVRDLGGGAANLSRAAPDLTISLAKLNRLANMLAFNPGGAEGLTGDTGRDQARQEGYLYWLAWTAQNGVSVFSTSDSQGAWRRTTACNIDPDVLTRMITPALARFPLPQQLQDLNTVTSSGFGGACP